VSSFACSALSVVLASVVAPVVHADNAEVIDYRRHVMRTLGEQTQALAMVAQKQAPAENFEYHVAALAAASTQALKAFEPKAPGGNATPAVWDRWKDFSDRMNQLVANVSELERTTRTAGMAAAVSKVKELLTCNSCHEAYRTALAPRSAKTEPANAIRYRQHMMNSIDAQSAGLGQILAGEIAGDNLSSHLEVLALTATSSLKAFEPRVPGGEARDAVWNNWPDFAGRMKTFAQKATQAARTARENGNDAALPVVVDALNCKGCHDTYREKK
jgi:cytochrome c556